MLVNGFVAPQLLKVVVGQWGEEIVVNDHPFTAAWCAAAPRRDGNQLRYRLPCLGYDNLFTSCNQFEQLGQVRPGLANVDFGRHESSMDDGVDYTRFSARDLTHHSGNPRYSGPSSWIDAQPRSFMVSTTSLRRMSMALLTPS